MKTLSHSTQTTSGFTSRGGIPKYAPQVLCGIANKTGKNQSHTGALGFDFMARIGCTGSKNLGACASRLLTAGLSRQHYINPII